MATKAEVKARLRSRVEDKVRSEFTWTELVSAVQAGTAQQKTAIVMGVRGGSATAIGRQILLLCRDKIRADADAELDTMLADDSIDLTEFDRVL